MHVLIVTAHPEPRSFNFALRNRALAVLEEHEVEARLSDLVQEGFDPVAGPGDFVSFDRNDVLQLGKAQRAASEHGGFSPDIVAEQEKLRWCDALVLQFPLWWGTYPAVMKGWIERVLASGFAYGRTQTLTPRTVMLSVTTGGAENEAEDADYRDRVSRLADDVFGYMGWTLLPPFLAHGPAMSSDEDRARLLDAFAAHVERELISR